MDEDIQLSKTLGFLRAGAGLPVLRVADVDSNVAANIDTMSSLKAAGFHLTGTGAPIPSNWQGNKSPLAQTSSSDYEELNQVSLS